MLAAVIVTYNRSEKLARVLSSLTAQSLPPEVIYVVDNASTDDTASVVEQSSARYIRLPENVGGAGGFSVGVKQAYNDGADYIWLSDDDAYPEENAMEMLVNALNTFENTENRKPPFACSLVKWTDGSHCEMNTPGAVWDWPRFYKPEAPVFLVSSCSFVSCLIPRWAVAQHGLPIRDYFIWYDDAEYTQRLSRSHPGLFVPDSVVIHDIPENQGVNYGFVTPDNLWKFRFGARNETSARLRMMGWAGVAEFWIRTHRQMKSRPWSLRFAIYRALLSGLWFRPKIESVS